MARQVESLADMHAEAEQLEREIASLSHELPCPSHSHERNRQGLIVLSV